MLTDDQRATLRAATDEAIKWLNENMHPEAIIVIGPDRAEVMEGVVRIKNSDHIKD